MHCDSTSEARIRELGNVPKDPQARESQFKRKPDRFCNATDCHKLHRLQEVQIHTAHLYSCQPDALHLGAYEPLEACYQSNPGSQQLPIWSPADSILSSQGGPAAAKTLYNGGKCSWWPIPVAGFQPGSSFRQTNSTSSRWVGAWARQRKRQSQHVAAPTFYMLGTHARYGKLAPRAKGCLPA